MTVIDPLVHIYVATLLLKARLETFKFCTLLTRYPCNEFELGAEGRYSYRIFLAKLDTNVEKKFRQCGAPSSKSGNSHACRFCQPSPPSSERKFPLENATKMRMSARTLILNSLSRPHVCRCCLALREARGCSRRSGCVRRSRQASGSRRRTSSSRTTPGVGSRAWHTRSQVCGVGVGFGVPM